MTESGGIWGPVKSVSPFYTVLSVSIVPLYNSLESEQEQVSGYYDSSALRDLEVKRMIEYKGLGMLDIENTSFLTSLSISIHGRGKKGKCSAKGIDQ